MAFSFTGSTSASGAGVTSLDTNTPGGVSVGSLMVAVYAFENVAAGSGPWIVPNISTAGNGVIGPASGWMQVAWQAPSAAGVGIEVWAAIYGSGTHFTANFAVAQTAVVVGAGWNGEYNPTSLITGGPPRVASTSQVSGSQPPAPSVNANAGELIVACGGDLMTAGKFGTPSGFTNRVDVQRSGSGTVDAAIADATALVAGATGPVTFPGTANPTSAKGATATLLFRPAPTTGVVGGVLDTVLPPDLTVPGGWTFRFTAIDPVTGALVSGVNIDGANIVATDLSAGDTSEGEIGPFMLVPGPDA